MDVPKRLQRMRLQLQRYNLDVIYKPGKHLFIADALSRNFSGAQETNDQLGEEELEVATINQLSDVPATTSYLEDLRRQTANDAKLRILIKQTK